MSNNHISENNPVIIVAEDDEINFRYLSKLLTKIENIEVIRVKNGKDAVSLTFKTQNVAMVLMDIKMPQMDGLTATKIIKETKPEIPVIAVTAFAMEQDKTAALESGCDEYISKPFHEETMLYMIKKYLNL